MATMTDAIFNGVTATLNGLFSILSGILDIRVVFILLVVCSALWMAACEIEELDRQGVKPDVLRH